MSAVVAATGRGAEIRPMAESDLGSVAELRGRLFRTTHRSGAERVRYLSKVFLENPWLDPDLPPLVLELKQEIIGFLGCIPRPFSFHGRRIRAAVLTQFMVEPEHRGSWPVRLLEAAVARDQDLILADAATRGALRLWNKRCGVTAGIYRFFWCLPLWRNSLAGRAPGAGGPAGAALAALSRAARAAERGFGVLRRDGTRGGPSVGHLVELRPELFPGPLNELAAPHPLHAWFDAAGFDWVLARVREKWGEDAVHAAALADGADILGCFVYVVAGDGVAHVMYALAAPDREALLMDHLIASARAKGAVELRGRYEPVLGPVAEARSFVFRSQGLGVPNVSRDPKIIQCLLSGTALVTGLDGEWWLDV